MIERINITGVHYDLDDDLKKYITRKIGRLDRFMPKHAHETVHADIRLKESKQGGKKMCICEAVVHLPSDKLTVHEATINMYAAVDIVEEKLKNQIKRYKEKNHPTEHRTVVRRVIGKLRPRR